LIFQSHDDGPVLEAIFPPWRESIGLDIPNGLCFIGFYFIISTVSWWSTMRVIALLTDYPMVDRIINHLKLTFVAERPPPPHLAYQEVLMTPEAPAEYLS